MLPGVAPVDLSSSSKRVVFLCDSHGTIISGTVGPVINMFGLSAAELIGKPLRALVETLPHKRNRSLSAVASASRFSQSEMWKSVLAQLVSARVVNVKHKNGTLIPVMLTTSAIDSVGGKFYAVLLEVLPPNVATLTLDEEGVVIGATQSCESVFGYAAREVCGFPLTKFIRPPNGFSSLIEASLAVKKSSTLRTTTKAVGGKLDLFAVPRVIGAAGVPVYLEVFDKRDSLAVITIGPRSHKRVAELSAVDAAVNANAKGGVNTEERIGDEEIGAYTLMRALGSGQCGVVRRGELRLNSAPIAVKHLQKSFFEKAGLAWPPREVEVMRSLHHPNIVALLDIVVMGDSWYVMTELVSGGEVLSLLLDCRRLTEDRSRSLFRDLVSAVDYLHNKGIVHRDLKLENCLLDEEGRLKLIDFGLANYNRGPLTTACGSPDYAAPELMSSSKTYLGPPVDVWAMGVMLFCMISGEFPFPDIPAILEAKFKWPVDVKVSKMLNNLVGSIFEVKPQARINIALVRQHEWLNQGYSEPPPRRVLKESLDENKIKKDVLELRADVISWMEASLGFAMEATIQSLLADEVNVITSTYKTTVILHPKGCPGVSSSSLQAAERMIVKLGGQFQDGVIVDAKAVLASSMDRSPRASLKKSGEGQREGHRNSFIPKSVSPNTTLRNSFPEGVKIGTRRSSVMEKEPQDFKE